MKGKVVLGVLAVTGILALSSTVAQAGGGIPVPLTSFFVCHGLIGASDQNQVVDAYSDNLGLHGKYCSSGENADRGEVVRFLEIERHHEFRVSKSKSTGKSACGTKSTNESYKSRSLAALGMTNLNLGRLEARRHEAA